MQPGERREKAGRRAGNRQLHQSTAGHGSAMTRSFSPLGADTRQQGCTRAKANRRRVLDSEISRVYSSIPPTESPGSGQSMPFLGTIAWQTLPLKRRSLSPSQRTIARPPPSALDSGVPRTSPQTCRIFFFGGGQMKGRERDAHQRSRTCCNSTLAWTHPLEPVPDSRTKCNRVEGGKCGDI